MLARLWKWLTQRKEPLVEQLTQIIEQEVVAAAQEIVAEAENTPEKKPRKKKQ